MTQFRRCSHAYPACVAARLAGELYGEHEMCPKQAAENEAHIRDEFAEAAVVAVPRRLRWPRAAEAAVAVAAGRFAR